MAKRPVKRIGQLPITTAESRYLRESIETIQTIAEESKNHFVEGFRKGGGQTNNSDGGWERRKDSTDNAGRGILVKSGALSRDIDVLSLGRDRIVIGTKRIPYAATHNEGLKIPDRFPVRRKALKFKIKGKDVFAKSAKGFTMPRREFIGQSDDLNRKNVLTIKEFLNELLRS